ncbi:hypothetical protein U6A24_12645 [Aquimarina gracilis]|uniref:Ig-like domain-containing protein n=1 Tax=Aquimarina gracilis TaxID=874422 RepID=A0ABU5ZWV4_9FLAO|nr:hypothetical protein [Aquimarina gracilis]MEB3346318.1 hypothetical protein [Aquimarina gracilis]
MNTAYKYLFKTLTLDLPAGNTQVSKTIELPKGAMIAAAAKVKGDPNKFLNLGLFEQGQEINTPIDISFWRDREIGNHMIDGFVPVNSDGSSEIEARLITPNGALTSAVNVQIVFVVAQERVC